MRALALAALVLAALTSSALAQPGMTQPNGGSPTYAPPPPPPGTPAPAPQPGYGPYQPYQPYQPSQPQPYQPQYQYQPQPEANLQLKSSSTAVLWSIGTTLVGMATIGAAFDEESEGLLLLGAGLTLVGPSAGHIYAGETGHAAKMSLLRAGGVLVFTLGAIEADESYDECAYDDYNGYCSEESNDGEAAMWIGGLVVVGATLYDLYDSGRAATRYNDRARKRASMQFSPMMMSKAGGGTMPGAGITGTF